MELAGAAGRDLVASALRGPVVRQRGRRTVPVELTPDAPGRPWRDWDIPDFLRRLDEEHHGARPISAKGDADLEGFK